jgi:putative CRISPR-associated protein (TIGR02619 family)
VAKLSDFVGRSRCLPGNLVKVNPVMKRIIISSIGTSLLTNSINRQSSQETHWYKELRNTANYSDSQLESEAPEAADIIEYLRDRALRKLGQADTATIRNASAELNGIYGLYNDRLDRGREDIHWLIPTNTAQGRASAQIVCDFLRDRHRLNVNIYEETTISTASSRIFADGIDALIVWMEATIPGYRAAGYSVCFNLVGSFKSLQGYLNTIGMFYADEMVYIFEGEGSDLITIPRLPIAIDPQKVDPYAVELALMNAGASLSRSEVAGLSEGLLYTIDDEVTLSNWGKLVWTQRKAEILSADLLPLPRIEYAATFIQDYKKTASHDRQERIKLQEVLAKVSHLLRASGGNVAALKGDGGVQYDRYETTSIDHFRVNLSERISCRSTSQGIELRYYGSHAHVQAKEGVKS